MSAKLIGLGLLVGTLSIYISSNQLEKAELGQALSVAHSEISLLEAKLAVANSNVAVSNAVIDKQNTFIAALEAKLHTAKTLAEVQLADIAKLTNAKRAAVRDMPAEETLNTIEQHLTEFCNG
jgi:hypothetical protein